MRKGLIDLIGVEGMESVVKGKVNVYYNLINERFNDDFNKYKVLEVLSIDEKILKVFNWYVCKVKVERIGKEFIEYLCIRDYGCRGSFGFEVLESSDGCSFYIVDIDYDREIRKYSEIYSREDILKEQLKLLKIIKEKGVE